MPKPKCQLKAKIDYKPSEYHHLAFFIGHLAFLHIANVKKISDKPNALTQLSCRPGVVKSAFLSQYNGQYPKSLHRIFHTNEGVTMFKRVRWVLAVLALTLMANGCGYNALQQMEENVFRAWSDVDLDQRRMQILTICVVR